MKAQRVVTLFISHSSKNDESIAVLELVSEKLKEKYEVWTDRCCIQAGQEWRNEIFWGIWKAHGAVLLLSKEALEVSTFVPAELVVLTWRHRIGARSGTRFPVYPILIGDMKPEDLKSKNPIVAHVQIDETQALRAKSDGFIEKLLERIEKDFEGVEVRDGLALLTETLEFELRRIGVSDGDIEDVRKQVKNWPPTVTCKDRVSEFAQEILRADPTTACEGIARLRAFKGKTGDKERLKQLTGALLGLVNVVIPFWIDEELAYRVPLAALGSPEERVVGVDAANADFVIESLLARAYTTAYANRKPPFVYVCEPPAGVDAKTWIVQRFVEQVVPASGPFKKMTFEERRKRAKAFVESRLAANEPCFLLGCEDWLTRDALDALRKEFGAATPALIMARSAAELSALGANTEPLAVDQAREEQAFTVFGDATIRVGE